jgi:hypothetical protein
MNSDHPSKINKWLVPLLSPWTLLIVSVLGFGSWIYFSGYTQKNERVNVTSSTASLPQIAQAIKDEKVKELTIRGDIIIATSTDHNSLVARKESGTGAVQTLQLLGVSTETLANLPIAVEESPAEIGGGTILWYAIPIILVGFFLFRNARGKSTPSSSNFSSLGQSNPRISPKPGEKGKQSTTPGVTFRDVA